MSTPSNGIAWRVRRRRCVSTTSPRAVQRRTEDLLLDWIGSTLAGKGARPVESIARFGSRKGRPTGRREVLIHRRGSSPLVAAAINAAASHVAEQDDVHNGSVFHPAAVVFPPALAVAQALQRSGRELLAAAVAGYEVGHPRRRVSRPLALQGVPHHRHGRHAGRCRGGRPSAAPRRPSRCSMRSARPARNRRACGSFCARRPTPSNCTRARGGGGLERRLPGGRRLHRCARHPRRRARAWRPACRSDADPSRLTDGLGTRWVTAETSFKFHASCRHTHPAADALLRADARAQAGSRRTSRASRRTCTRAPSTCWGR